MQRRDFLAELAMYSAICAGVPNVWRVTAMPVLADDPFTLGVASGDPSPNGTVLWTRLAPKLFEPEGGMDGSRVTVQWEVADDEQFARVVKRGIATAIPEVGYSVHADVVGLEPDRWYFYRFTLPAGASPVGRVRTAPAADAATPLRFAFASCQHWETGFYTAYGHMAREDRLDLVAFLGDYIYESNSPRADKPRRHYGTEPQTLAEYRTRYAQVKSDRLLQAAHHAAPWIVTWDDHEVDNNYAGLVSENEVESEEQMHNRRAAAYQAWWEHMPARVHAGRSWADLNITRRLEWGRLATMHVVDTRQYRSNQSCGDGSKDVPCGNWADTTRTMMGADQERWLDAGFAASKARWQVLANQTRIARLEEKVGEGHRFHMDQWGGYPTALKRLMTMVANRAPNRTVAITGDVHSHWVNELRTDYDIANGRQIGVEFIGTSISSDGDGWDEYPNWPSQKARNPQTHWHSARRGYVMNEVSADAWRASFRVLPYVVKEGAPLTTPAEFVVHQGRPGIDRA